MGMKLGLLIVVSATLLSGGGAVYAALVSNGGFETGDFTDWTVTPILGKPPVVTNKPASGPLKVAHSGTYGALFFGDSTADISQTLQVPATGTYDLDFWLEPVFNDDALVKVSLGGTIVFAADYTNGMAYTGYTIPVLVNAGPQTLDFNIAPGSNGPVYLDDISMNSAPVPEPGTMMAGALLLVPLGWGAVRQIRKKCRAA